jgi:hypothetical protein
VSERVLPDSRVVHYWDGAAKISDWFAENVENIDAKAWWDVYYLYGEDAEWEDVPGPSSRRAIIGRNSELGEAITPLIKGSSAPWPRGPPQVTAPNVARSHATRAILGVTVTAGLLSPTDGGAPGIFVERLSAQLGQVASGATSGVWWTYAFLLEAIAAFNPCGFALPSGAYLNDGTRRSGAARVRRALAVGASVAGAFAVVFGVASALFSIGYAGVSSLLSGWRASLDARRPARASAAMLLSGSATGSRRSDALCRCSSRWSEPPPRPEALGAAVGAFALYCAGMATTLGLLALMASLAGVGIVSRGRTKARLVPGLGAGLLLVSGAYVVYYWLTAGRLLLT